MSGPLAPIDVNIELAQRYLSYIINDDNNEILYFKPEYILNKALQNLYKTMQEAYEKEKKLNVDIIYDYCRINAVDIKREDIELIKNFFTNKQDLPYLRKQIEQQYIKQVLNKQAIEDLLINLTSAKDIDLNKLKNFYNSVGENLSKLQVSNSFCFTDKFNTYKTHLDNIDHNRFKKKSMGDPVIDKLLTYPGMPGDMLSIAMRTGTGKTTYALNLALYFNYLNVPVVYFALDMGETTTIDRMICIKEGITLKHIYNPEKPDYIKEKILNAKKYFENLKNFILYSEPSLSLEDLDKILYQIKVYFKDSGYLKRNDYFVIVIDTLDIVSEFSGADAYGSQGAIDQLHSIVRKHNVFCINLLQINENKIRGRKNLNPDNIESLRVGKEDIWGASAYSKRSRSVLIGERLKHLKLELFPLHEDRDLWELEEDILTISCVKQNDGPLFSVDYLYDPYTYRISPIKE